MLFTSILVTQFVHHTYAFSIPPLPGLHSFVGASHTQAQQQPLQDTLDAWIEREEHIALDKLLANVVASPSREEPDYWFQCQYLLV
jgi:glucoamylase